MAHNVSVMGIYPDRITVSDATNVFLKQGYRPADISVLASDNQGTKDFGHEKHNKALQGAGIGVALGALVGAGLAWFISTQATTIVDFRPLISAGPVLAALAGAGAGGVLGWLLGLVTGMRLSEYVAKRYAGRIRHGGILVSVHCDSPEWCERAKKTLISTGARSVSAAAESAADYGTTDKPTDRAPAVVAIRGEALPHETVLVEPPVPEIRKYEIENK